jgi:hypothetical protein
MFAFGPVRASVLWQDMFGSSLLFMYCIYIYYIHHQIFQVLREQNTQYIKLKNLIWFGVRFYFFFLDVTVRSLLLVSV